MKQNENDERPMTRQSDNSVESPYNFVSVEEQPEENEEGRGHNILSSPRHKRCWVLYVCDCTRCSLVDQLCDKDGVP